MFFSAAARQSVLQYKQKERRIPFDTYNFPVLVQDKNGKDVKRYKSVRVWDGSKDTIRQAIRDTFGPFRDVAEVCGWSEKEMMKEFRSNVMIGEGKDKFDEALEEDDIDYDNPGADNFELTLANLADIAAEQKFPANKVDVLLRELTLEYAMKYYAHKPTTYLRERKAIEKASEELHRIDGTQPTDEMKKEEFLQSLGEDNIHWLFEVDQGDRDNMTREEIAARLDAHLKKEVEEAKRNLKNNKVSKKNDEDSEEDAKANGTENRGTKRNNPDDDSGEESGEETSNAEIKTKGKANKKKYLNAWERPCDFHPGTNCTFDKCPCNAHPRNNNFNREEALKVLSSPTCPAWYKKHCNRFNVQQQQQQQQQQQRQQRQQQQPQ